MAKKSGKPSKLASNAGNSLSGFDENALSALTARIEKGLDKSAGTTGRSTNTSHNPAKKNQPTGGDKQRSRDSRHIRDATTTSEGSKTTRGVKRDANGKAKVEAKGQKDIEVQSKSDGVNGTDRDALLQEILSLGGTADDLDLVADALSDEDDAIYETDDQVDKSFKNDLAQFIQGLGLAQSSAADIESEIEEDEDEESEPIQDDQSSDESSKEALDATNTLAHTTVAKAPPQAVVVKTVSQFKDNGRLIFPARPDWHAVDLPALPVPEVDEVSRHRVAIASLHTYAKSLLEADSEAYASKHLSTSSSHKFLSTIMTSGTLSDKVSALTLVVQESPVHTTKSFESLLGLAKKRSRGQAVEALGAIKDLLAMGVVLPSDRRLRTFATQPGLIATMQETSNPMWNSGGVLPGNITKAHLISWAFEDWLKEAYFDMLKVLEGWCNDEVEYARSRAVSYVYELLKEKPEQESNLLRLLVNKLGDPEKKIASRASYLLLQLQISHPLMKGIIISSIEDELLLRPGQSLHAKYYAINTLNQTILSLKEETVARRLLDIYFDLFVTLLKKPEPDTKPKDAPVLNRKGQIQGGGAPMGRKAKAKANKEEEAKLSGEETVEKMISAVLTGVNRAFPFSKSDDTGLTKHMDTLFRITHSSNFNTSIQSLMLIEQLATSKHLAVDRFYRTLYESLLDPRLVNSSKHALFLNLLFRALRSDINIKRVKAFVKRLLQIIHLHQPPFICGVLYLLRELEANMPGLRTLYTEPEDHGDDDEEIFKDVVDIGEVEARSEPVPVTRLVYDGKKRDPEYSLAEKSCNWESLPFLQHFHPSVSLFADRLLSNEKMPPKPDLASHNLASFLDRFVYKNIKTVSNGPRGSSIMQPLSGSDNKGALLSNKASLARQAPLNTEAFWQKKAEDVAVDEVFFHKYFNQIGKSRHTSTKKKQKMDEGVPDGGESEDEDEIWQALVESRPEVEGPSDDESDMEMLDLDDSDGSGEWSDDDGEVDVESDTDMDVDVGEDEVGSDDILEGEESDADEDLDALFSKEARNKEDTSEGKEGKETSRQKKRRMKSLPTFASVEDYAALLDNDDDEDI